MNYNTNYNISNNPQSTNYKKGPYYYKNKQAQYKDYKKTDYKKAYLTKSEILDEKSLHQSLQYVIEKYPTMKDINQLNVGIARTVKTQKSPRFFVIKSFTEEDIHKVQ